jgi:hypothetical protein
MESEAYEIIILFVCSPLIKFELVSTDFYETR